MTFTPSERIILLACLELSQKEMLETADYAESKICSAELVSKIRQWASQAADIRERLEEA